MEKEKKYTPLIVGASIVIPVVVAILYFAPTLKTDIDFGFLPPFYATVNAATAVVLCLGFRAIVKGKVELHKRYMSTAILLSIVFLLAYILYHLTKPSTPFGGTGWIRTVYYFLLLSHILLSVAIVPMVLISYTRALSEKFDKHRKIARITLPIWLYVAVSGVVVYLMISPYYT
jgi:putative membrane protein